MCRNKGLFFLITTVSKTLFLITTFLFSINKSLLFEKKNCFHVSCQRHTRIASDTCVERIQLYYNLQIHEKSILISEDTEFGKKAPKNNAILNQAFYANFLRKCPYWRPKIAACHNQG
jgi:hypothetical protein